VLVRLVLCISTAMTFWPTTRRFDEALMSIYETWSPSWPAVDGSSKATRYRPFRPRAARPPCVQVANEAIIVPDPQDEIGGRVRHVIDGVDLRLGHVEGPPHVKGHVARLALICGGLRIVGDLLHVGKDRDDTDEHPSHALLIPDRRRSRFPGGIADPSRAMRWPASMARFSPEELQVEPRSTRTSCELARPARDR